MNRQERLERVNSQLTDGAVLSAAQIEKMADFLLEPDIVNPRWGDVSQLDYPILSKRQLRTRQEMEVSYDDYIRRKERE